jgi:hypothetical protein
MDPIYVPLLSALGGAIIGSAVSIATIVVQAKIGDRRERIRQATMLALEDLKLRLAHGYTGTVFPISIYLHYQLAILDAAEKNELTPERIQQIDAENMALIKATRDSEAKIRKELGETPQGRP